MFHMNVKTTVVLLVALTMLASVATAGATSTYPSQEPGTRTITLYPAADNYPDSKYPILGTYGKMSFLYVGNSYDHVQDIWGSERIYIRFNVSDLPRGFSILKATLRLWQYYAPASEQTYEAHRVLGEWDEKTQNWDNQPRWDPTVTSEGTAPPQTEVAVEWDITKDVSGWYGGQLRNYGTMIKAAEEEVHLADASSGFWSREYPKTEWQPQLIVLLGSGTTTKYTVTVAVNGLPHGINSTITVDGHPYGSVSSGQRVDVPFGPGTHSISTTDIISASSTTRYRCNESELLVNGGGNYTFSYAPEYSATFSTEPSSYFETPANGWYPNATVLQLKRLERDVIVTGRMARIAFDGWYINSQKLVEAPGCTTCPGGTPTTILVDRPVTVEGRYRTEYYLNATSPIGKTEGSGWYASDSTASFSLDTTRVASEGVGGWLGLKRAFVRWDGSQNFLGLPTEPQGSIIMRGPATIEAIWQDDWSSVTVNLALLITFMFGGIVAVVVLRKRKVRLAR